MKYLFLAVAILSLASCSPALKYYTSELDSKAGWSEQELKKIQFYISDDIVMWRDISKGETEVIRGKIKMVDGRKVEEVVIKRGTPGTYLFSAQKNHYAIGFDGGDDRKYLIFGPSEQVNGRYVLLAREWGRQTGKVTYGDKVYQTGNNSAYAYLLVSVDRKARTKVSSQSPSGRRVK